LIARSDIPVGLSMRRFPSPRRCGASGDHTGAARRESAGALPYRDRGKREVGIGSPITVRPPLTSVRGGARPCSADRPRSGSIPTPVRPIPPPNRHRPPATIAQCRRATPNHHMRSVSRRSARGGA
jgi:hypothetical protein